MSLSVGELAKLAGVSIRTLHHYDEIGLLSPSERTRSGYRRYDEPDVERLHAILVYRELGFDLAGIRRILDDPTEDPLVQLNRQRELLAGQVDRFQRMLTGVERMMNRKRSGVNLTLEEMREVFGTFDPAEHTDEARDRWGKTDAYRESQRRASQYRKEDWEAIRAEVEEIEAALAASLEGGVPAEDPTAMRLAERHRLHISRWFYPCTREIHLGLAGMYVADARFAAHYDDRCPGLSVYLHDAIRANAARLDGEEG